MRIERGQVVRFTVPFEAVIGEETHPVVRYDSAHGTPHRDKLDRDGRVVAKDWFADKSFAEVLTDAISDIDANWSTYREDFLRRKR